jgi:hypothetical protein
MKGRLISFHRAAALFASQFVQRLSIARRSFSLTLSAVSMEACP